MKRLEKMVDFRVKDAEEQLKFMEDDYEQAKAQATAMKSINSILRGGLSKSMEEELALNNVNNTINENIAEMNRLLDGSNDILLNFDLDSEASLEKADEILRAIDEGKFSILNEASSQKTYTDFIEVTEEKLPEKRRWT
jgi:ankyrin repeat protein